MDEEITATLETIWVKFVHENGTMKGPVNDSTYQMGISKTFEKKDADKVTLSIFFNDGTGYLILFELTELMQKIKSLHA